MPCPSSQALPPLLSLLLLLLMSLPLPPHTASKASAGAFIISVLPPFPVQALLPPLLLLMLLPPVLLLEHCTHPTALLVPTYRKP